MNRKYLWTALLLALLSSLAATTALAAPQGKAFGKGGPKYNVALIGDIPYNAVQESQTQNLFRELNAEKLAFIAHDGDIKSGSSACTDDVYAREKARFESSENLLVYTPGDNEWADCHCLPNPTPEEADPLNRLDLVRETFFATEGSLGEKAFPLERQGDDYPENTRWKRGGITFVTLHLVGSNNNRPTVANPAIGSEEEYAARNAANLEWLSETFDEARASGSPGVMLVMQANIFEEDVNQHSGFAEFKAALADEVEEFGKPVVLVHGDTHTFRIDNPMSGLPNFSRVETFGSPEVHWVHASVDARSPRVFSFQPELVDENLAP